MMHSLHVADARVPFPVTVTLSNVMPEMTESLSPSQSRLPFVASKATLRIVTLRSTGVAEMLVGGALW